MSMQDAFSLENAPMLKKYLDTLLEPRFKGAAKSTLSRYVRYNGDRIIRRHRLIEEKIKAGGKVIDLNGEMILETGEDTFLDSKNITKHGLRYAAWLSVSA
jgi:hypothetical protein